MTAEAVANETYAPVAIELLVESPLNPRKTFSPASIDEMAASIRSKGVLAPLIARKNGKAGHFEVICGARRLRGSQKVGLKALPVIVREYSDADALEIMAIENGQREDVAPLEEAAGYAALLKLGKYDVHELAKKIGKSARHVQARVALLKAGKEVQAALAEGHLTGFSPEHAQLIERLPDDQKIRALKTCIQSKYWDGYESADEDDGLSQELEVRLALPVRDFRFWIQREVYRELEAVPWSLNDAELVKAAGPCSNCPKRTGRTPGLFDDLSKDCCQNAKCFEEKMQAHLARTIEAAKEQGAPLVAIAEEEYYVEDAKGTIDKPVGRHSWNEVKPNAKDAVQAVIVDGPRRGKIVPVRLPKPPADVKAAAQGKKPGEKPDRAPLAQRKKAWNVKRIAWICDHLRQDLLPKFSLEQLGGASSVPAIPTLLALAACTGTHANAAGHYHSSGSPWSSFEELRTSKAVKEEAAAHKLLKWVVPVLQSRLEYHTQAAAPVREAHHVCGLMGLKWADLERKAVAAHPDPKGWAKEEAEAKGAKVAPAAKNINMAELKKAQRAKAKPKAAKRVKGKGKK